MISNKINSMIAEAMKNQNKDELNVYRLIKSKFVEFETSKANSVLTESDEIKILKKMISQREESKKIYLSSNRNDLAEKEQKEISIIEKFVPKEANEDDIRNIINSYKNGKEDGYVISVKDMKPIMELVKEKYGFANGKIISDILKGMGDGK